MDIGRIGFIQSLGLLIFAPILGYVLDHGMNVFIPLIITATCCSVGCLWRGIATNVMALYIAAAILSLGANLWTVVLLHVSHCTPREHRSHVLSGFAVQETGLRLLGKLLFPFWDWFVRKTILIMDLKKKGVLVVGQVQNQQREDYYDNQNNTFNTTLFRYRIHMGVCTFFCLFGTVTLLVERRALQQSTTKTTTKEEASSTATLETTNSLMSPSSSSPLDLSLTSSPEQQQQQQHYDNKSSSPRLPLSSNNHHKRTIGPLRHLPTNNGPTSFRYVAILSALLLQSWSSTVLVVCWPLFLRDQFQFAATEYGVIVVIASICCTSAVASFPALEHHLGRIRTAACGATIACVTCCLAFVVLPNLLRHTNTQEQEEDEEETNPDAVHIEEETSNDNDMTRILRKQAILVHVVLAIIFEASVRMLEPSLKSILSLTVPVSAQNRSLGFMSTLGGLGGMGGNLMGTWLFHQSKQASFAGGWLGNGTLPFAAVGAVLALAFISLWALEWEEARHHRYHRQRHDHLSDTEEPPSAFCEEHGNIDNKGSSSPLPQAQSSSNSSEAQLHDMYFPLMQAHTTYEMKLD